MAKKSKDARVQVILECTEQKATGVPGISRYITLKVSTKGMRTIEKKGLDAALKEAQDKGYVGLV